MLHNLTMVVHGESGSGKSWFGDTAPAPRLILDAEGGTKFTPSKKVLWDPLSGPPPMDATDSVVVMVKSFQTLGAVYNVLKSGNHPFNSVVLDSITEIQKRCLDSITGTEAATQQAWGELLRKMEGLVRAFRDLSMPNGTPGLQAVVFIAGTKMKDGVLRAHLQGQLAESLPYYVDVVGYLHVGMTEDGQIGRKLLVTPVQGFSAKDRTGRLGFEVISPCITNMIRTVSNEEETA